MRIVDGKIRYANVNDAVKNVGREIAFPRLPSHVSLFRQFYLMYFALDVFYRYTKMLRRAKKFRDEKNVKKYRKRNIVSD